MKEPEQDRLRRELPMIVNRLSTATGALLAAVAASQRLGWKDLGAAPQIWEAKAAVNAMERWLAAASGPHETAPLHVRQDAEMR